MLCVFVDHLLIQCWKLGSFSLACSGVRTAHPVPQGTFGRDRKGDLSLVLLLGGDAAAPHLAALPAVRTSRHSAAVVPPFCSVVWVTFCCLSDLQTLCRRDARCSMQDAHSAVSSTASAFRFIRVGKRWFSDLLEPWK